MRSLDDHAFRALLDERGIARTDAGFEPPLRENAYAVFGQSAAVRFELDAWERNAARFFSTTLGLTVEKKYTQHMFIPKTDIARVVIAERGEPAAVRTLYARPTGDDDLAAALIAERASRTSGMHLLARRCPTLWIIEAPAEVIDATSDRPSLVLAAILSSVLLGPILAPGARAIFGVRTARIDLEKGRSSVV